MVALLRRGVIALTDVSTALRVQQPGAPLWRALLKLEHLDPALVFAEAARVHGFAATAIRPAIPPDDFLTSVLELFPKERAEQLFALGLLPVSFNIDAEAGQYTLILATHDPTNPDVQAFLRGLRLNVECRFAPQAAIAFRLRRYLERHRGKTSPPPPAPAPPAQAPATAAPATPQPGPPRRRAAEPPAGASVARTTRPPSRTVTPEPAPTVPVASSQVEEPTLDEPLEIGTIELEAAETAETEVATAEALVEAPPEPPAVEEAPPGGDGVAEAPPAPEPPAPNPEPPAPTLEPSAPTPEPPPESAPEPAIAPPNLGRDRVVSLLLRKQVVTLEQVEAAAKLQRENRREALWRLLAQVKGVHRDAVFAEAARVYAFPTVELAQGQPNPEFVKQVLDALPEATVGELQTLGVLPLAQERDRRSGGAKLVFVTHDPARPEVTRLLEQARIGRFTLHYASEKAVAKRITEVFPRRNEFMERVAEQTMAMDLGTNFEDQATLVDEDALEAEISRSNLINLFEAALVEAVRGGASDLHIFPNPQRRIEIMFRIDGRLQRWYTEDKIHPEAFLAVVKDNATNVDRFERDKAQDGFIQRTIDGTLIRFRVSVLPIANANQDLRAESIVIRVIDDRKVLTDLRGLGMLDVALERFERAIRQPHGMVILTGPTGSGKSTTLVAALHQVISPDVNVLTVEDPVEYIIKGVRQIKLNDKLNLEGALRAILRHDPDIVMVGEMRDKDTAEMAVKLANTGHLTFSTLHTNDAPSAVSRLYKMGVEPFLIAYAINLVVAQRLIRTLCTDCRLPDSNLDPVLLAQLGFDDDAIKGGKFFAPGHDDDCPTCGGKGYKGRRAVCETLYFSKDIRHLIVQSGEAIDEDALRQLAIKEGMLTLQASAAELVKQGHTSVEEMIRVTAVEE